MTLTMALTRSINVIPVKLSIALGNGNPKLGRAKIREMAKKAGIRSPLPDTPSMPIGADEVTVLDHTGGYAMFVNAGKAVKPHAVLEVRNSTGELIWRFDRDGKQPVQVITPQVAMDMNMMMNQVVEAGTARRAILDGIKAAGKTGTTNAHRDAWFVGYTGNFIMGVYSPMHQMTGGSLPAQTWHGIMEFAHQGVELRNIPGIAPNGSTVGKTLADSKDRGNAAQEAARPTVLTKRGTAVLVRVERMMDDATRALAERNAPGKAAEVQNPAAAPPGTLAASERPPAAQVRGN
jgi:penicillin-binding protein 1A